MLKMHFGAFPGATAARNILCIGAHSDDIEIGCGGTILRLLAERPVWKVTWVVLSASSERRREAMRSARQFLGSSKRHKVVIKSFRDSYFPYQGDRIKDFFIRLKEKLAEPDLVFTHSRSDLHQDHRLVSELTWNTFRSHLVLEYEIPKYDGDLGSPNFFVNLNEQFADKKVQNILRVFQSQRRKHWFTEDVFLGLLRMRAIEAGSAERYAEAFYCRKAVF